MTSFFSKIKQALGVTSNKISSGIASIFKGKKIDASTIEELEELLISADMGVSTASVIIEKIRNNKYDKDADISVIQESLAEIISKRIALSQKDFTLSDGLNIILVSGVNGNGKTTTIGKLASMFAGDGKKVVVAACDTFRAAAIDQLEIWAKRSGCKLVKGEAGSDPASIAYRGIEEAKKDKADVLMIDTAGRLHNHQNLMAELAKISKVIEKNTGKTPQHSLLVLDATTGQNAFNQVEQFGNTAGINGLVITKLDGTAKAGVVVGLSERFKIPIYFVGLGEAIGDLKKFDEKEFAKALVGL